MRRYSKFILYVYESSKPASQQRGSQTLLAMQTQQLYAATRLSNIVANQDPVLLNRLHRKLLPVCCIKGLLLPWASVAGRGSRRALTPPAPPKVCIVVLPERWVRRLHDNPASTVMERCRVQALVWKLSHCPLRGHPLISFPIPSVDSVGPPCRGEAAVADCLQNPGMRHLATFLSPSMPRCRNDRNFTRHQLSEMFQGPACRPAC